MAVHLVCELAENERRLASPERARFKKMTSADTFNRILTSGHLTTPTDLGDTLTLDTTRLTDAQAADHIAGTGANPRTSSIAACKLRKILVPR